METLIQSLHSPECYPHSIGRVEVRETHISWVLLTGKYAYKIKKPVNLGFLDFTSLEKRLHFCNEEIRLNGRLAPHIYLDVVPILGTRTEPRIGKPGEERDAIEFAVRMNQFPPDQTLDIVETRAGLTAEQIDEIADICANFHSRIPRIARDSLLGEPESLSASVMENFNSLGDIPERVARQIREIKLWTEQEYIKRLETFRERKAAGFVRECNGDMHLGNMALTDGRITIFDCIEFNEPFRWIDVISEVAFVTMDLIERGHKDHAYRFLNRYLELTGDYRGLAVFRYYLVYRAMVRAKVASIRAHQNISIEEAAEDHRVLEKYVSLASDFVASRSPFLILTCGLSGSGKTRASRELFGEGIIRVRSDVERKRLHNLAPAERTASDVGVGLYGPEASNSTYAWLLDLATFLLANRFVTVVDATFLEKERRDPFRLLAQSLEVPFVILHCTARPETLKARVLRRLEKRKDASEANVEVLEAQIARGYAFTEDESRFLITLNTDDEQARGASMGELLRRLRSGTTGSV